MIENTEAYKGRKFTCSNCGYVASSDATDDFDVEYFSYCPYCGSQVGEVENPHSRCDTCTHYVADEVPPICYMCCKGIEDNYKAKEHSCYDCEWECLDGCSLHRDDNGNREPVHDGLTDCKDFIPIEQKGE